MTLTWLGEQYQYQYGERRVCSVTMVGEGRGRLFIFAPLGISLLHCVLVFYPFDVDCADKQDRQAWTRSLGRSVADNSVLFDTTLDVGSVSNSTSTELKTEIALFSISPTPHSTQPHPTPPQT